MKVKFSQNYREFFCYAYCIYEDDPNTSDDIYCIPKVRGLHESIEFAENYLATRPYVQEVLICDNNTAEIVAVIERDF